jgi:hypothetical protein
MSVRVEKLSVKKSGIKKANLTPYAEAHSGPKKDLSGEDVIARLGLACHGE